MGWKPGHQPGPGQDISATYSLRGQQQPCQTFYRHNLVAFILVTPDAVGIPTPLTGRKASLRDFVTCPRVPQQAVTEPHSNLDVCFQRPCPWMQPEARHKGPFLQIPRTGHHRNPIYCVQLSEESTKSFRLCIFRLLQIRLELKKKKESFFSRTRTHCWEAVCW